MSVLLCVHFCLVAPPGGKQTPQPAAAVAAPPSTATSKSMPVRRGGSKYVDIEVTNMRKTIAKRLTESKV